MILFGKLKVHGKKPTFWKLILLAKSSDKMQTLYIFKLFNIVSTQCQRSINFKILMSTQCQQLTLCWYYFVIYWHFLTVQIIVSIIIIYMKQAIWASPSDFGLVLLRLRVWWNCDFSKLDWLADRPHILEKWNSGYALWITLYFSYNISYSTPHKHKIWWWTHYLCSWEVE